MARLRRQMVGALALGGLVAGAGPMKLIAATQPPSQSRRRLTFTDDFSQSDVARINEYATGAREGAPAWRSRARHPRHDIINQEKQAYVDPQVTGSGNVPLGLQPFSISDGVLSIAARPLSPRHRGLLWGQRYASGIITSELTHQQRYGWFEIRARWQKGRGLWPAFWLLPAREAWPPEIDIFEGSGDRPDEAMFSVHEADKARSRSSGWVRIPASEADGFRTFACEWTPRRIAFYVQGQRLFECVGHGVHEPMYMLANLALGSHDPAWIPDPDATTPVPVG